MAITYAETVRNKLRAILGTNKISDLDTAILALAEDVDSKMASYWQGTLAERPAAGQPNRFFKATDKGVIYHDTGTIWEPIMPGLAIRATTLPATGVSGDYIVTTTNGGTLTLPGGQNINCIIGAFYANTEGSMIVKSTGTDPISLPSRNMTSCQLAPNTGMTFMWDGSLWRVITGRPLPVVTSTQSYTKAEAEALHEPSPSNLALITIMEAQEPSVGGVVYTMVGAPGSSVRLLVPPGASWSNKRATEVKTTLL